MIPDEMVCLIEAKAKGEKKIDLIVNKNEKTWAAYELKVELISESEFNDPLDQAMGYAKNLGTVVHLVNFYHEASNSPVPLNTAKNIVVVNIKYNSDCTKFEISTADGYKNKVTNNRKLVA
jgi:hypothetical protein